MPDAFDDAVAAFLAHSFERNPTAATYFGLTEHDQRLDDVTADGFARREADAAEWLERVRAFDPATLSPDQQVDLALLQSHLGAQVATADFAHWRRSATAYLDNGVFELFAHGTRPEAAATEAAVARLAQVPAALEAGRANLDPTLVDPDLAREWAGPNIAAQAAFMRHGLGSFVTDPDRRRRLEAAGAEAASAYDAFAEFVQELAGRATGSFAFGETRYDAVLRIGEGFDFGAQQVRAMGREQMAALDEAMGDLARTIAGTTDWRAVVPELRGHHPDSMSDLLHHYREETARARAFVDEHGIVPLPPGEVCAVEPAPLFRRAGAPVASYFPPAYFGPPSKGTFNVPFTPDGASAEAQEARLRSNSFFEIPAVTVHEAYPGHHLHFAAAQATSALRQVLTSTYMIEGWGLYVEQMMGEQGYYATPEARLGQLSARMFRAGRMVVDTGLHLGELSMDEATAFMAERCGLPGPTARGEVLRYCARATQASAYLTGALEIERLARAWTAGGQGTLPQFHQALVTSGKLPLGVAARAIGLA